MQGLGQMYPPIALNHVPISSHREPGKIRPIERAHSVPRECQTSVVPLQAKWLLDSEARRKAEGRRRNRTIASADPSEDREVIGDLLVEVEEPSPPGHVAGPGRILNSVPPHDEVEMTLPVLSVDVRRRLDVHFRDREQMPPRESVESRCVPGCSTLGDTRKQRELVADIPLDIAAKALVRHRVGD